MAIFGGDPRYVYNQVLYRISFWFDITMIPTLLIILSKDFRRADALYLPIPFIVFEILRICLNSSHTHGDIPLYVAYLFICFMNLGLIFGCIFAVRSTAFFFITMFTYAIIHFIQLFWSIAVYLSFQQYQDAFYQFSQEQIKSQNQIQNNDIQQLLQDVD